MNCPKCSKEINDNALTCPHCEYSLNRDTVKQDDSTDATDKTVLDDTEKTVLDGQSEAKSREELKRIGKYTIIRKLGRGGMGEVYLAHDPDLNRDVALKTMIAGEDASDKAIARFMGEARSAGKLQHPGIVGVHEVGKERNLHFMVMDYVEGKTLKNLIDEGDLTPKRSAEIIRDVANALHYAHEQGIIHRDIKPGNVMLKPDESVHLMDFGLARNVESDSSLTKSGEVMGTPAYLNPEQAGGESKNVDARSDVYSLGTVFYEMLTGDPPVRGTNLMQILYQVLEKETLKPTTLNPDIPRDLEIICLKAMFKEPARRYQTAKELADDLDRFLKGEPIEARSASIAYVMRRRILRHKAVSAVSTIAIIILITLTTWYINSLQKSLRETEQARDAEAEQKKKAIEEKEKAEYEAFVGNINLADRLAEEGAFEKAEILLDSIPERNRHWEWGIVKYKCHQDLLTLKGHSGYVKAVAFSSNGKYMLTGSEDNTAKLWDFRTGEEVLVLNGHSGWVSSVDFSPDNKYILTGSRDGTVRIWDTGTGRELNSIETQQGYIRCVDWSPDGKSIVSTGRDNFTAKIWDAETGKQLIVLKESSPYKDHFYSACFSPDGKYIVTADTNHNVIKWDSETGLELLIMRHALLAKECVVTSVAFSPDGTRIVSGGWDRTAKIWDAETGGKLLELIGHSQIVFEVEFSPDGRYIATASGDGTVKLWDSETGREINTLKGHTGSVWCIEFSPDGKHLLSGSTDLTARLWSIGSRERIIRFEEDIWCADVSFKKGYIVTGHEKGIVKLWSIKTGKIIRELVHQRTELFQRVREVFVTSNGNCLITNNHWELRLWDTETGEELQVFKFNNKWLHSAEISLDGKKLLTEDSDNIVKLWDIEKGKEVFEVKGHTGGINASFFPDGKRILTTSTDGTAKVWDASTGQGIKTLIKQKMVLQSIAFSPDGERIIIGGDVPSIWDAESGELIFILKGHANGAFGKYSSDGKRIITFCSDNTAKIWDAKTGRELITVTRNKSDYIIKGTFMPDIRSIVTVSTDKAIIWPALDWTKTSEELEQEKLEKWRARWIKEGVED